MEGDPVGYGLKWEADLFFLVGVGYDIGVAFDPTTGQINADFKLRAGAGFFANAGISPVINPGNGEASPSFASSGRMLANAELSAQAVGREFTLFSAEAEKRAGEDWQGSVSPSPLSPDDPAEDDGNDRRVRLLGARVGARAGGEIDFDWSLGGSSGQELGDVNVGGYQFNDVYFDGTTLSGSYNVTGSRITRRFEKEL